MYYLNPNYVLRTKHQKTNAPINVMPHCQRTGSGGDIVGDFNSFTKRIASSGEGIRSLIFFNSYLGVVLGVVYEYYT